MSFTTTSEDKTNLIAEKKGNYPLRFFSVPCQKRSRRVLLFRMEDLRKPKNRRVVLLLPGLFQRGGVLRRAGSFLVICCLILLPPVLPVSCRKADPPEEESREEEPEAVPDSAVFTVRWQHPDCPVQRLDLFVYGSGGTQELERHLQFSSLPDSLEVKALPGEKILVGIANSPHRFKLNALGRYDAMTQLAFSFTEDDPACPVLGGECVTAGGAGTVPLKPLLCRIRLVSVSNTMDDYELLEDPRVRLVDIPDAAQILRQKEFRPAEVLDAGPWQPLPCDIGFFPQKPDIDLWCYPNDTPENILGTPRPALEFECRIAGETCSFEVPLPSLGRACAKEVELIVDGPDEHHYRIY